MYYVDSQRTITRRESSLITSSRKSKRIDADTWSVYNGQSTIPVQTESSVSVAPRAKGAVQQELITMLFESMLDSIVESWDVIVPPVTLESVPNIEFGKIGSDPLLTGAKKKKSIVPKPAKSKAGRSKLELENGQDAGVVCWWSAPDEKAIIRFRNGNIYEGNISMKCMHGEGRFQWADGTVYLGQFKANEIAGNGLIQWKNDTWYQGEFAGNLRHGKGLYVDSRLQRSYAGSWHHGTKHGEGVIFYSKDFKNSYDGQWIHNERFGYGSREYCASSGYRGEWERNVREGNGLMIWPNNDFYRGEWKNGVMSGHGMYIWDAYLNNSMSLPSIKAYRGQWEKGKRNGYGLLNLGLGLGSFYKGEFMNNLKNGAGKFVTNNGTILQDKNLFIDDNVAPMKEDDHELNTQTEPCPFDIGDNSVDLSYHIELALKNIDKQEEIYSNIVNDFIEKNKLRKSVDEANQTNPTIRKNGQLSKYGYIEESVEEEPININDLIKFEEVALSKSLSCYETDLKNIYYKYATMCNTEDVYFTPIMIRLYLWQLFNDCNLQEKDLTLYDIDMILYHNREWLARSPHDPFEKIYFWQFLHSLIAVASKLYITRKMPGPKPDTMLANAFRSFMENDILPGSILQKGRLVNGFGSFIPLKPTYELYKSIGEPHTVRNFLRAVRRAPHFLSRPQPSMTETPDDFLPLGRNVYIFGDEMSFIVDTEIPVQQEKITTYGLKLFNFANLSSKTIIQIFSKIFPQLCKSEKIMDLSIKLTFFDFFEAFVECAEESIRVKDEEIKWREKFTNFPEATVAPHSTPTGYGK